MRTTGSVPRGHKLSQGHTEKLETSQLENEELCTHEREKRLWNIGYLHINKVPTFLVGDFFGRGCGLA